MLHRIIYPYKLFIFNGYVQSPALPLLTILTPPEGPISKTTVDWTAQAVKVISRWLGKRRWTLLGDGAQACVHLARVCDTYRRPSPPARRRTASRARVGSKRRSTANR